MLKNLSSATYKLIRSKYLLPISPILGTSTRIEDGYVLMKDKSIVECGEYTSNIGSRILEQCKDDIEIIGSYNNEDIPILNGVTMPGFVKGHGHDHESILIGIAKDVPLTSWLDLAVNTFTGFLAENEEELWNEFGVSPYFLAFLKAKMDDISYGITSSMTHHCNHCKYKAMELAEASSLLGITNIIAVGAQDRNYDERILDIPYNVAIDRLDNYYEQMKDMEYVQVIPGPDQFFSNGPELLSALKEWSREKGTLFHIHSSEEPATTKWFTEENGMTPVEYGNSIGVLDENTVIAHQVNNTENDLKLLCETGAKIIHNPLANTILGSGMPPVLEMEEMGIPWAISTDGSGSADNQNILNAARVASQYQKALNTDAKALPAQMLLEKITIEPAKILGLNKGSLEPGKDADVIMIDLDHINMTPTLIDNVVENLIWASNGNEVKHVIANGEVLIEDYKMKLVDEERILKEIRHLAKLFYEFRKDAEVIKGTGLHV